MFFKLLKLSGWILCAFSLALSVLILTACPQPDVEPDPTPTDEIIDTPTPTPAPTPFNQAEAGTVWFEPKVQTVALMANFTTEIHVNSGTQMLAAYGIDITWDIAIIDLDIDAPGSSNGVIVGADGFISATNANVAGVLKTSGFDAMGKDPGSNLHLMTINWTAVSAGETELTMDINDLADQTIGRIPNETPHIPSADTGNVIVE